MSSAADILARLEVAFAELVAMRAELLALMPPPVAGNGAEGTYDFAEHT